MQPIDLAKLVNQVFKNDPESAKQITDKLTAGITEKQQLAIGILLKQTLQRLSDNGLISIDTQKAIVSAKKVLPGEFAQLYIQDRVQQHKISEALSQLQLQARPLTVETVRQWFSGQLIQAITYQPPQKGQATLLIHPSGFFEPRLLPSLTELTSKPASAASEMQSGPTSLSNTGSTGPANSSPETVKQLINKLFNQDLFRHALTVNIKTELPLQIGQQLLLQVNKSANEVSFQLKHSPRESHIISQYINQLTSKQQAIPALLASLQEINNQKSSQTFSPFTEKFIAQVNKVIQQFPAMSDLNNARQVRNAIHNSGYFYENKMLNMVKTNSTEAVNQPDFKASLLQLITMIKTNEAITIPRSHSIESNLYKAIAQQSLLTPEPGQVRNFELPSRLFHAQVQTPVVEPNLFQLNNLILLQNRLLDQLEGVISRIILTQLHSREGGEQQFLNFEIPFRHNDQQELLQLKIREEYRQKEAKKGNKIWTVNLAFNLQSLGAIRIYITMDKKELSIQFWTEKKASQALFHRYFHILNERLSSAGFNINQLIAYTGMPEKAREEQQHSHFIVDEKV